MLRQLGQEAKKRGINKDQLITATKSGINATKSGINSAFKKDNEIVPAVERRKETKMFGVSLDISSVQMPAIISSVISYFNVHGVEYEGMFRISGAASEMKFWMNEFEHGETKFTEETDVHVVASLLKQYLRDMPEPLIPFQFYTPLIELAAKVKEKSVFLQGMTHILSQMPQICRIILKYLLCFLKTVSLKSDMNKMTPSNISIVFAPNILRPVGNDIFTQMQDSGAANRLFATLISKSDIIFKNEPDPPKPPVIPQKPKELFNVCHLPELPTPPCKTSSSSNPEIIMSPRLDENGNPPPKPCKPNKKKMISKTLPSAMPSNTGIAKPEKPTMPSNFGTKPAELLPPKPKNTLETAPPTIVPKETPIIHTTSTNTSELTTPPIIGRSPQLCSPQVPERKKVPNVGRGRASSPSLESILRQRNQVTKPPTSTESKPINSLPTKPDQVQRVTKPATPRELGPSNSIQTKQNQAQSRVTKPATPRESGPSNSMQTNQNQAQGRVTKPATPRESGPINSMQTNQNQAQSRVTKPATPRESGPIHSFPITKPNQVQRGNLASRSNPQRNIQRGKVGPPMGRGMPRGTGQRGFLQSKRGQQRNGPPPQGFKKQQSSPQLNGLVKAKSAINSTESVSEWGEAEVVKWMIENKFESLKDTFQDNCITGAVLLELTNEDLKEELGISALGTRKRLLNLIKDLQESNQQQTVDPE